MDKEDTLERARSERGDCFQGRWAAEEADVTLMVNHKARAKLLNYNYNFLIT